MPANKTKRSKEADASETKTPNETEVKQPIEEAAPAVAVKEEETPEAEESQLPPAKKARKSSTRAPKIISTEPGAFNNYLFQLLLFKAEKGNYHVPKEEYPELQAWLQHIKREYKNYAAVKNEDDEEEESEEPTPPSTLTEDQIKVLQHLHVPLTSVSRVINFFIVTDLLRLTTRSYPT